MSRASYPRNAKPVPAEYHEEMERAINPGEAPEAPKKRRAPGTSEFVTMKISQALYGTIKTIASLTGKTSSEFLNEIVARGLEEYKGLTIDELLNK